MREVTLPFLDNLKVCSPQETVSWKPHAAGRVADWLTGYPPKTPCISSCMFAHVAKRPLKEDHAPRFNVPATPWIHACPHVSSVLWKACPSQTGQYPRTMMNFPEFVRALRPACFMDAYTFLVCSCHLASVASRFSTSSGIVPSTSKPQTHQVL